MRVKFVVQESDSASDADDVTWDDEMDRRALPRRSDSVTHEGTTYTVTDVTTGTFAGETHAVLRLRRETTT